ncbi:sporulation protein [Nocardia asteroides]|uniref:sporulation protein n=1 Tax=Nocardia asteroides TaxID=1824 RepID=UPI001E370E37|nr:sporulation protein [Nocardia asteroides]UGT60655.1 sporulation protein [Nocardia asteroides]
MFKKLLAAVGVGGAEVETELFTPGVQPGGVIEGVIRVRGGQVPQRIDRIAVELVTRVEHEYEDGETHRDTGFGAHDVFHGFDLAPGAFHEFRFGARAHLETPITFFDGQPLPGTVVALRTVLAVSGAVDATDSDPIGVGALPAQHILLDAVRRWGFPLRSADVEHGRLHNTPQQLPFFQEIEFGPSHRFPRLNQLEVSFVPAEHGMSVVFEADKRGGLFTEGRDAYDNLWVEYANLPHVDWAGEVGHRIERLAGH